MPDSELVLGTTTDSEVAAEAALGSDEGAARVAVKDSTLADYTEESKEDGTVTTSYEKSDSSRHRFEEELAAAEADLIELSKPAEADATAQQSEIDIAGCAPSAHLAVTCTQSPYVSAAEHSART
jgi:hypothetical protein